MEKEKEEWKKEADDLRKELKRKSETPIEEKIIKRRKFDGTIGYGSRLCKVQLAEKKRINRSRELLCMCIPYSI